MTSIEFILGKLRNVSRSGSGWIASCPAHHDEHPSLSITVSGDMILVYCHSAGCSFDQIRRAIGTQASEWHVGERIRGKLLIKSYDYKDEHGQLLYQKVRLEPKDFRIRRWTGEPPPNEWVWYLGNMRRVVYKLDSLTVHGNGEDYLFIVEGEKDVDTATALGLHATCNDSGASKNLERSKWKPEYTDQVYAAGYRHFVVIPDNDDAGRAHAAGVTRSLLTKEGVEVKIVTLPGLVEKGDLTDWVTGKPAGQVLTELQARMDATPPMELLAGDPPPESPSTIVADEEPEDDDEGLPAEDVDNPISLERGLNLSGVGNAKAFADRYAEKLRYVQAAKSWYVYTKSAGLWKPADGGQEIEKGKRLVNDMFAEAARRDDESAKKWALRSATAFGIANMLKLAAADPRIAAVPTDFDNDLSLLSFRNGVLDLKTLELRKHRPEDMISKAIHCDYDPDARSERWKQFLLRIQPDPAMRAALQKIAGSALPGRQRDEKFYAALGKTGAGKSTFLCRSPPAGAWGGGGHERDSRAVAGWRGSGFGTRSKPRPSTQTSERSPSRDAAYTSTSSSLIQPGTCQITARRTRGSGSITVVVARAAGTAAWTSPTVETAGAVRSFLGRPAPG
jgi:putative DNA primase/helicase